MNLLLLSLSFALFSNQMWPWITLPNSLKCEIIGFLLFHVSCGFFTHIIFVGDWLYRYIVKATVLAQFIFCSFLLLSIFCVMSSTVLFYSSFSAHHFVARHLIPFSLQLLKLFRSEFTTSVSPWSFYLPTTFFLYSMIKLL